MTKIFISYCTKDAKPIPEVGPSRVTTIYKQIRREIGAHVQGSRFQILRDDENLIKTSDDIDDAVREAIRECDIALLFLSEDYFLSDWCKKEFRLCYKTGKPIFAIEIDSVLENKAFLENKYIPDMKELADQARKKRYVRFWAYKNQIPVLFGYPTPRVAEKLATPETSDLLDRYYDNIRRLGCDIKAKANGPSGERKRVRQSSPKSIVASGHHDIFLACPTRDVARYVDRLEKTLTEAGRTVLRFDPNKEKINDGVFETALEDAIDRCDVYIQLLGAMPGRRVSRQPAFTLVPYQYEIAKKKSKDIYLWRIPNLDVDEVDRSYAEFLTQLIPHDTGFEKFGQYVIRQIEDFFFKKNWAKKRTDRRKKNIQPYVAVDAAESDIKLAHVITEALANHVNVGQLDENISRLELKEHVGEDDAIILVYGESNEGQKRIQRHFPMILRHKSELAREHFELAVGDASPDTAIPLPRGPDIHLISIKDHIDETALANFLSQLGVEGEHGQSTSEK